MSIFAATSTESNFVSATLFNGTELDLPGNVTVGNGLDEDLIAYIEFRDTMRFWVQKVLVPFIVTIGIVGNSVTIVVLTQRRMRSSTNLYLTALATSDVLYLIFSFTLSLIHYPPINEAYSYLQYYGYGLMMTDFVSNTSVWLTVSFTVERWIAVCHPIRGKMLCTESRAKFVIATVFVLAFMSTLPTPFEHDVVEWWDPVTNQTAYRMAYSDLGKDPVYTTSFYWFTTLLFTLIPLTLLAVFNSFLICAVHRSKQQRRKMTSVRGDRTESFSSQETRITIMLIAVVVLFLLCQVPTSVIMLYEANVTPTRNQSVLFQGLGNVCNFLMAINASCNFLLYSALSDRYRKTFLTTFLRCWHKPPSPLHSQSVYYRSTVTETTMSRSPSCRERSPSQRSNSSRYGSTRSRGRGSVRSVQDGSMRRKQRYLTVPDGDPQNGNCRNGDEALTDRDSPSPPPNHKQPDQVCNTSAAASSTSSPGHKSVTMCFKLPKGPLKILGARNKDGQDGELRSQSVPLTKSTDYGAAVDNKDKLTSL